MADNMFEMEVEGLDEAIAALEKLSSDVDGAVEAALSAGALEVENEAKNRAPYVTGTLRRSITHKIEGDDALVGPFSAVPYAARIEFGFVGADSLGRVYNQAAQPYLRPALQAKQADIRKAFISSVNDIIRSLS